jgi:hypothetical protein
MSPRSINVVFRKNDFIIQKDLAAQLVVRLLSICNFRIYIFIYLITVHVCKHKIITTGELLSEMSQVEFQEHSEMSQVEFQAH